MIEGRSVMSVTAVTREPKEWITFGRVGKGSLQACIMMPI